MNFNKLIKILENHSIQDHHIEIMDFIEEYQGYGFGGHCGIFAINLNQHLGGIGEYYGAINRQIWTLGEYWIGHVALKVGNSLYDFDGEIEDLEIFKAWGQVDEDSNEAELYNLSVEECYDADIVNLTHLWGASVEEKIKENTSCE